MLREPIADRVVKGTTYATGGLARKRPYNSNSVRGRNGNPTRREVTEAAKNLFRREDDD